MTPEDDYITTMMITTLQQTNSITPHSPIITDWQQQTLSFEVFQRAPHSQGTSCIQWVFQWNDKVQNNRQEITDSYS